MRRLPPAESTMAGTDIRISVAEPPPIVRLRLTRSTPKPQTKASRQRFLLNPGECVTKFGAGAEVYPEGGINSLDKGYGLHKGVLSPIETLAQSVSTMAPSTSPSLTIPLVFTLAGNGTWFVYLLTTAAMLLVGFCVSRFARMSASPGSLYSYTADTLRPSL